MSIGILMIMNLMVEDFKIVSTNHADLVPMDGMMMCATRTEVIQKTMDYVNMVQLDFIFTNRISSKKHISNSKIYLSFGRVSKS